MDSAMVSGGVMESPRPPVQPYALGAGANMSAESQRATGTGGGGSSDGGPGGGGGGGGGGGAGGKEGRRHSWQRTRVEGVT